MASPLVPVHVHNHQTVVEAFGYWPDFHDAEVRSLLLDRTRILFGEIANPCIELVIHAFEWTESKPTQTSRFNHHLVRFFFERVAEVELFDFNHQNAIFSLRFEPANETIGGREKYLLQIDVAHGLHGSFIYEKAEVLSVTPIDRDPDPSQR